MCCKLDDTLPQNAKDGGCRSIDGFRKRKKEEEKNYKENEGRIRCTGHIQSQARVSPTHLIWPTFHDLIHKLDRVSREGKGLCE